MAYTRNQPVSTDDLDVSQPFLFNNTNSADDSFAADHYAFSNLTAGNGLHNKVTTPRYSTAADPAVPSATPPLTPTFPAFYGFQLTAPLGILQFSRGPVNAVQTPVTSLHSTAAALTINAAASSPILDFTGINNAYATVYFYDATAPTMSLTSGIAHIFWIGGAPGTFRIINQFASSLTITNSGNTLQITNGAGVAFTNVYWTLHFHRLQ